LSTEQQPLHISEIEFIEMDAEAAKFEVTGGADALNESQ
jgi:hypothetical protein